MGGQLLRRLGVEPGEGRVFAWAGGSLLVLGWADVSVKNVAETLFLKRIGVEQLPLAFLVSTALLVPTTYAVGRLAARVDRQRLLPLALGALGLTLVPLWLLVDERTAGATALLLVVSKQLQSLALLVFFVSLTDLLDARQSKRLFAPLMAGVTLGTMLGSFASDPISDRIGIAGLLPFSAAALVLAGGLAAPLRRRRAPRFERRVASRRVPEPPTSRQATPRFATLWRESGLFRLLAISVLCNGLLGPMLYVQFQHVADVATTGAGGEERLLAFYAQFRGWLSGGILLTQVLATSSLFRVIGIPLASAVSPAVYLLGFLGLSLRLSLPAGVAAMSGAKLQDNAVYDPALRALYNLFPEDLRSWSAALLEGPVKRVGGLVGNLATWLALQLGSVAWIGALAIPISAVWLVGSLLLRRAYPELLLQMSARLARTGEEADLAELLDAATLRSLAPQLADPDPGRCRAAIDLVSEAKPRLALAALAGAARAAPAATRPLLVAAIDRALALHVDADVTDAGAAADVAALLDGTHPLGAGERVALVRAWGRLARADADGVAERALADRAPTVRLAAAAALHRWRPAEAAPALDAALSDAIEGEDAAVRQAACQELRALLSRASPGADWEQRLRALTRLLERPAERAAAAAALADVAARHGAPTAVVSDALRVLRADADPRVQAAWLRFSGHAGLADEAAWLVGHLAQERSGGDTVRAAARDGLRALGAAATEALLVELAFGKRSTRDEIVPLLGALEVDPASLRASLERELDTARRRLVHLHALVRGGASPIVIQRLGECLDEALHTVLLLLAAIHDEDRIAELADPLRRARGGRQHAILLEALEALLSPQEKAELVPLLEDQTVAVRARAAAGALDVRIPDAETVTRTLLAEADELTRTLVAATRAEASPRSGVASGSPPVQDRKVVPNPVDCALLLKGIPLFERLTTRQLMDLASVVKEQGFARDENIVTEGDVSDCLYAILEGRVEVVKGGRLVNQLGPGDFFGEVALFDARHRTATVVACEAVRVLRLERTNLLRLMEELPAIAITLCETLSRRVRDLLEGPVRTR